MKKEEMSELVIKHIKATVPSLAAKQIDSDMAYETLGINSLDVSEIVSRVTRELKVNIPRAELAKLSTVTQLVDVLFKAAG
jgi:acyl carrier protein